MDEIKYKVLISGKPAKGRTAYEVIKNLAALYHRPPEEVAYLLSGRPASIKEDLDMPRAERLKALLDKAGLVTKIVQMDEARAPEALKTLSPQSDTKAPATPKPPKPSQAPPPAQPPLSQKPRVAELTLASTSIAYAVLPCSALSMAEGGAWDFARAGARSLSAPDIAAALAYCTQEDNSETDRIMVFLKADRRPLSVQSKMVKYWTFEGIKGETQAASLRALLVSLINGNPEVVVDQATMRFLEGHRLSPLKRDEATQATAMGTALTALGIYEPLAPAPPPAPPKPLRKPRPPRAG